MEQLSYEGIDSFTNEQLLALVRSQREQIDRLTIEMERLIEAIRVADQDRFGRHTEKLDQISGQMSLFNEAEVYADESVPEPTEEEILVTVRRKKKAGGQEEKFKDLPHETHEHKLSDDSLDEYYGKGCWRRMPQEKFLRVRCQPATYTVEDHIVDIAVGTGGDHQDEFLRGDREKGLLRNSPVTPSLMAAILNAKYMNAQPLYRIENQFASDGVMISRQTMANWVIRVSQKYLEPFCTRLQEELLKSPVTQADETPVQVINDNDPTDPDDVKTSAGNDNWMWVHRSGEFEKERQIVLYEYQRSRHHKYPLEFYSGYKGIVETDGLQQYHMLEDKLEGFRNANCWVHARRAFANAVKAIGKNNPEVVKRSLAYKALVRIAAIYHCEEGLKNLTPEERLRERQETIKPLVDEFFAWAKKMQDEGAALPKGDTAKGFNYCINQEKYLRVFLENGLVPIDNSASERAIRPFTIGRKNWVLIDSIKGAKASAAAYSIVETAKLNNLNCYRYFEYLLTELPKLCDDKGNIDTAKLDPLLPWAETLPEQCRKPRR